MRTYEIIELIESAKINFKTARRIPPLFDIAIDQLDSAIKELEESQSE